MRVIIQGSWNNYVGSEYTDALGEFESLYSPECQNAAADYAWDIWSTDREDDEYLDEGPDYYVEEYDPEKHDCLRAGGGSFADDFDRERKNDVA